MTNDEIASDLEKLPFVPFRLHLVSGNAFEVRRAGAAAMLRDAIMVFHVPAMQFQPFS